MSFLSSTLYVQAAEESLETSFQALEIVNSAYVEPSLTQTTFIWCLFDGSSSHVERWL